MVEPFSKKLVKVGVRDFHKVSWWLMAVVRILFLWWELTTFQMHISFIVRSFCIQVFHCFNLKYLHIFSQGFL